MDYVGQTVRKLNNDNVLQVAGGGFRSGDSLKQLNTTLNQVGLVMLILRR